MGEGDQLAARLQIVQNSKINKPVFLVEDEHKLFTLWFRVVLSWFRLTSYLGLPIVRFELSLRWRFRGNSKEIQKKYKENLDKIGFQKKMGKWKCLHKWTYFEKLVGSERKIVCKGLRSKILSRKRFTQLRIEIGYEAKNRISFYLYQNCLL